MIYDDVTGIVGHFGINGTNLQFNAAIGPMSAAIKDGRINLALDFTVTGDNADGNPETIGDFVSNLDPTLTGSAEATLPVFFPTDSEFLGDIAFSAGFALGGSGLELTSPSLTLPDFSSIDLSSIDPFGSVPLMLDSLDFFLQGLQDVLDGEVFGVKLP